MYVVMIFMKRMVNLGQGKMNRTDSSKYSRVDIQMTEPVDTGVDWESARIGWRREEPRCDLLIGHGHRYARKPSQS